MRYIYIFNTKHLFFHPSITHTHTRSSQVLGYSVKQPEWAQKSQSRLCSRFPLKFLRLTGTGATKPDSCEGFSPLCQDSGFCRVGGAGGDGIDRRGYVLSQLLEDFAFLAL